MSVERVSVWVLGDQLLTYHPAVVAAEKAVGKKNICVVLIESTERLRHLPYQRKKIVLLLSAMRHYEQELRRAGYAVEYVRATSFLEGLQQHIHKYHITHLYTMAASEYDTRRMQQEDLEQQLAIPLTILPNTQFLVEQFSPYPHPQKGKRYIMENFYRAMRDHFQILMEGEGKPAGGKWNYDEMNREPLPAPMVFPKPFLCEPDEITQEVMVQVEADAYGIGTTSDFKMAVTRAGALQALDKFLEERLEYFGPYEDAMSIQEGLLYHSLLSPYVNIGLLEPMEMIRAAEFAYYQGHAPLHSVEGFIRQVVGWREYMYWQYWQQMPALRSANSWTGKRAMPLVFWNGDTDMNCIRHVVQRVLEQGYSHHIERLMIVCNFCLLTGIDPAAVAEWFLACYVDAYDWVVLPNVIGMGMNADGGRIATKPYIASANYIHHMSDYCASCCYNPKKRVGADACPYNYLYWNFVIEHETVLRANPRLGKNVLGLRHISEEERQEIAANAARFLDALTFYTAG